MRNRGKNAKDIKEKMKSAKYKLTDYPILSFDEMKELFPDVTKKDYSKKVFSVKDINRFLDVMQDWLIENEDAVFIQEFLYFALPKAVEAGVIQPFDFKINNMTMCRIVKIYPFFKEKVDTIKKIQDYKVLKKGLTGEWYAGLVITFLKTHSKEDWTETIKQEIVNKTQILNIDPLEKLDE